MTEVILHVYDIANSESSNTVIHINKIFKDGIGLGGIFHCAVQVYGDEEWSFGFCEQGSGVFSCPPSKNPMYTYRESMVLGKTNCSIFKVNQILRELNRDWRGSSYDLLSRNCNHFCDEFCERLGVPKLPGWVNRFANAGDAAMEVAESTALKWRQAKAEVVSASKVAYKFLASVTSNNSSSPGSSESPNNSSRGSPRIQTTWFRNIMSIGNKPGQSTQAANRIHFPFQTKNRSTYPSFSFTKKREAVCQPRLTISSVSRGDEIQPSGLTASDAVLQFYHCINEKNLKKIGEFISEDCCFEDYSYVKAFRGKKEVTQFFEQLTECMGNNVRFVIQSICQGDDSSVAVTWHLEWKGKHIPFTRGCSFCDCSKLGDRLVIKHARAMIESPIKPGPLVLTLFKVVIYLFDEFPAVTEKFLQKPHVILEFLQRIYKIFLEPFVHPVMEFYMSFSKLALGVLGYIINILIRISQFLLK